MSQHYFTERPAARPRPGSVHVVLPDLHLELETDAGDGLALCAVLGRHRHVHDHRMT